MKSKLMILRSKRNTILSVFDIWNSTNGNGKIYEHFDASKSLCTIPSLYISHGIVNKKKL